MTVHEYAATLAPRYRAARRGEKGRILDEFCATTGMPPEGGERELLGGAVTLKRLADGAQETVAMGDVAGRVKHHQRSRQRRHFGICSRQQPGRHARKNPDHPKAIPKKGLLG